MHFSWDPFFYYYFYSTNVSDLTLFCKGIFYKSLFIWQEAINRVSPWVMEKLKALRNLHLGFIFLR
ncbi:hypothetical protein A8135_13960 [Legionella jamestowniensis]|uniref:Uncharacterized protein n=1 Tax=Legionella jamestowniensis TaxID=455 RepID=A0ABX2XSJ4_9GAMM|nr:hypothetical protein A8135_13960 [Legionella jamestowniensis]